MNISFEYCDFENPVHLSVLTDLLYIYMIDPMGGVQPLNKLKQLRLVDGLANHPTVLVLFILYNGVFAGLAVCFVNFSTFYVKSYLYIHDLIVNPVYRGNGLGKAMMKKLEEISIERGYCKITLEVREDNAVAQNLYRSLGYDECQPKMLFWTKKL